MTYQLGLFFGSNFNLDSILLFISSHFPFPGSQVFVIYTFKTLYLKKN